MSAPIIKVTSPSFSKNDVLINELTALTFETVLNSKGARLEGQALCEFLQGAHGAIIGLEKIDGQLLDGCPSLQIVSKYGVGLDNVDQIACRERGVAIGWTPGVNKRSVAEMTVGLIIGLARNLFASARKLSGGCWDKNGGRQLSELKVGIIGLGNVGQELVDLLRPFGCELLGNDIADRRRFCRNHHVGFASKEDIFRTSDVVTLHVPLTTETRYMIDDRTLALMKPNAFLINTSRGTVVNQAALKRALQANQLAGAALDVYEHEPPTDLEFLQLPNLFCTPHIAGNAFEAVVAMGRSAIHHVDQFFKNRVATIPGRQHVHPRAHFKAAA